MSDSNCEAIFQYWWCLSFSSAIFLFQYAEKIIRKKVQIGRISGILEVKSPENDKKRNKKALVLTT